MSDLLDLAPECPSHSQLLAEGWTRRFLVGPERQQEVREIYETLGHEVRLEKVEPDAFSESCGACPASGRARPSISATRSP